MPSYEKTVRFKLLLTLFSMDFFKVSASPREGSFLPAANNS